MFTSYDPASWYWRADDGRIYSSASHSLVTQDDHDFTRWTSVGGIPTIWPRDASGAQTQASMEGVLAAAGVSQGGSRKITYKADLYRRATDDEAEKIEAALAAAPVRQRRLFEAAQYLDHADAEFSAMRTALVGLFGEARADELLAAS